MIVSLISNAIWLAVYTQMHLDAWYFCLLTGLTGATFEVLLKITENLGCHQQNVKNNSGGFKIECNTSAYFSSSLFKLFMNNHLMKSCFKLDDHVVIP